MTRGRGSVTNSATRPPSRSRASSRSIRSLFMAPLHDLARHEELVPVLDRHLLGDADLPPVRAAVGADHGVLRRHADQSSDLPSGHLRPDAIPLLELPPVHEDVKTRPAVDFGHGIPPFSLYKPPARAILVSSVLYASV